MSYYMEKQWAVSPHGLVDEVQNRMKNLPPKVMIRDVTLREGDEMPGIRLSLADKVKLAEKLQQAGVAELEVGYAGASEEQAAALEALKKAGITIPLASICRTYQDDWKRDIDISVEKGASIIKLQNLGGPKWQWPVMPDGARRLWEADRVIDRMIECLNYAKGKYGRIPVHVGLTDGPRTDYEWVERFFRDAVNEGADRISFHDSLSTATPLVMQYLIEKIKTVAGKIPIGVHCHNDFGLAVANTLGSVMGGATVLDVTLNGYGDRAGNAALEEVVTSLEVLYGVRTGVDMSKLSGLCKLAVDLTGISCQPHKAISGENAFLEESELHILGMLTGRFNDLGDLAFLPFSPSIIGKRHEIIFGNTSVWGDAIKAKLRQMGFAAEQDTVKAVRDRLLNKLEQKKYVLEPEMEELIREIQY